MRGILIAAWIAILGNAAFIYAQSPANLNANIDWPKQNFYWNGDPTPYYDYTYNIMYYDTPTMTDKQIIEDAFNYARRQEEIQKGLATNRLGSLNIPTTWSVYSDDEKMLYLLNAERQARSGVNYGSGAVLGKPFTGYHPNLDVTAQSYADYLVTHNQFTHNATPAHPLGLDPFTRVANTTNVGSCREFLSRSESLAGFWSSDAIIPYYIERSVFLWIYKDASSAWGHRETVLLQNYRLSSSSQDGTGFDDTAGTAGNYGSTADEGFLGLGVAFRTDGSYNNGSTCGGWGCLGGWVVALNMFDPTSSCIVSAGGGVSLPVQLTSFEVGVDGAQARLNWVTASELEFYGFGVEVAEVKSFRNQLVTEAYKELAFVYSKGGPNQSAQYVYALNALPAGTYMVRLRQQDKDGTVEYTASKKIQIGALPEGFELKNPYPNPFGKEFRMELLAERPQKVQLRLYDMMGREVRHLYDADLEANLRHQAIVRARDLPNGMYVLLIKGETFSKTMKIMHLENGITP